MDMSSADSNILKLQSLYASDSAAAFNEYLTLMEESEVPRNFLIWSLITTAAALLGKNTYLRHGPHIKVYANLFTVLLGPPAVRKSSAINTTVRYLESTSINFGPTDTGGQRHGLMSALTGAHRAKRKESIYGEIYPIANGHINPRSPSDMFLVAPELGRILGSATREMADFMVDLWDGAPIDYQTRASETIIRKPVVTLLGGTTPSSIPTMLPDNATGHGILSRILFIYSEEPAKIVPIPRDQGEEWHDLKDRFSRRFEWIDWCRSPFMLSRKAEILYEELYTFNPTLQDPRLDSYKARRADQLLKVAMSICALRMDTTIHEDDINLAHEYLLDAEPQMHQALVFFGRNKIHHGRMLMIEYLKQCPEGSASAAELLSAASSDLTTREADEALRNLTQSGDVTQYGESGRFVLAGQKFTPRTQRKRG